MDCLNNSIRSLNNEAGLQEKKIFHYLFFSIMHFFNPFPFLVPVSLVP